MIQRLHLAYNPSRRCFALAVSSSRVRLWMIPDDSSDTEGMSLAYAMDIETGHVGIMGLAFLDEQTLLCVHSDGVVAAWSLDVSEDSAIKMRAPLRGSFERLPSLHGDTEATSTMDLLGELGQLNRTQSKREHDSLGDFRTFSQNAPTFESDEVTASLLWTLSFNGRVEACTFWFVTTQWDAVKIAVGMESGDVILIDVNTNTQPEAWRCGQHQATVSLLEFNHDGMLLASCSRQRDICLWHLDPNSSKPAPWRQFEGSGGEIWSLKFSPSGRYIVSGGIDNCIYYWDLLAKRPLRALSRDHEGWIAALAWSSDERVVASASWDNTVGLFRAGDMSPLYCFDFHEDYVVQVLFVPNSDYLVSASYDHEIAVWDWRNAKLVTKLSGHEDWVQTLIWVGNGMVASAASDKNVRLWSVDNLRCEYILTDKTQSALSLELDNPFGAASNFSSVSWLSEDTYQPIVHETGFKHQRIDGQSHSNTEKALQAVQSVETDGLAEVSMFIDDAVMFEPMMGKANGDEPKLDDFELSEPSALSAQLESLVVDISEVSETPEPFKFSAEDVDAGLIQPQSPVLNDIHNVSAPSESIDVTDAPLNIPADAHAHVSMSSVVSESLSLDSEESRHDEHLLENDVEDDISDNLERIAGSPTHINLLEPSSSVSLVDEVDTLDEISEGEDALEPSSPLLMAELVEALSEQSEGDQISVMPSEPEEVSQSSVVEDDQFSMPEDDVSLDESSADNDDLDDAFELVEIEASSIGIDDALDASSLAEDSDALALDEPPEDDVLSPEAMASLLFQVSEPLQPVEASSGGDVSGDVDIDDDVDDENAPDDMARASSLEFDLKSTDGVISQEISDVNAFFGDDSRSSEQSNTLAQSPDPSDLGHGHTVPNTVYAPSTVAEDVNLDVLALTEESSSFAEILANVPDNNGRSDVEEDSEAEQPHAFDRTHGFTSNQTQAVESDAVLDVAFVPEEPSPKPMPMVPDGQEMEGEGWDWNFSDAQENRTAKSSVAIEQSSPLEDIEILPPSEVSEAFDLQDVVSDVESSQPSEAEGEVLDNNQTGLNFPMMPTAWEGGEGVQSEQDGLDEISVVDWDNFEQSGFGQPPNMLLDGSSSEASLVLGEISKLPEAKDSDENIVHLPDRSEEVDEGDVQEDLSLGEARLPNTLAEHVVDDDSTSELKLSDLAALTSAARTDDRTIEEASHSFKVLDEFSQVEESSLPLSQIAEIQALKAKEESVTLEASLNELLESNDSTQVLSREEMLKQALFGETPVTKNDETQEFSREQIKQALRQKMLRGTPSTDDNIRDTKPGTEEFGTLSVDETYNERSDADESLNIRDTTPGVGEDNVRSTRPGLGDVNVRDTNPEEAKITARNIQFTPPKPPPEFTREQTVVDSSPMGLQTKSKDSRLPELSSEPVLVESNTSTKSDDAFEREQTMADAAPLIWDDLNDDDDEVVLVEKVLPPSAEDSHSPGRMPRLSDADQSQMGAITDENKASSEDDAFDALLNQVPDFENVSGTIGFGSPMPAFALQQLKAHARRSAFLPLPDDVCESFELTASEVWQMRLSDRNPSMKIFKKAKATGQYKRWDRWESHHKKIGDMVYCEEGRFFLVVGEQPVVEVWSIKHGRLGCLHIGEVIEKVNVTSDGRVAIVGCTSGRIHLWLLPQSIQKLSETSMGKAILEGPAKVKGMSIGLHGRYLIANYADGAVILWDLVDGSEHATLAHHGGVPLTVCFDATGPITTCEDQILRFWSTDGQIVDVVGGVGELGQVHSLHRDLYALNAEGTIHQYRNHEHHDEQTFDDLPASFCVSPDGTLVVVGEEGKVYIFAAGLGNAPIELDMGESLKCVATSGSFILVGTNEGAMEILKRV